MRVSIWFALAVAIAVVAVAWQAAAAAPPAPVTADQLLYPGATVQTRIDVNGMAAMQLAGGAVDALTAQVQERIKAAQAAEGAAAQAQGAAAEAQRAAAEAARAQAAAIEQARDALKSLTGVTLVVMAPKGTVKPADFTKHYQGLLNPRGWAPMMTVQNEEEGSAVLVMLGPAGKGLFFGVSDKKDIVTALVTTSLPIGDLISKMMKSGSMDQMMGTMAGSIAGMFGKPKPPEPPEPPAAARAPAPPAQPEPAPEPEEPEAPEAPEE